VREKAAENALRMHDENPAEILCNPLRKTRGESVDGVWRACAKVCGKAVDKQRRSGGIHGCSITWAIEVKLL
jgi:hypothetical protein